MFLKAIRKLYPSYDVYRNFPYEYETSRLAFDLINGGSEVRQWIDDPQQTTLDLKHFSADELRWQEEISKYLCMSNKDSAQIAQYTICANNSMVLIGPTYFVQ